MKTIIDRIEQTYAQLNKDTINSGLLDNLYNKDITFVDPLHRIESLTNLKAYFESMYKNVDHIHFDFTTTMSDDSSAFLTWTMTFRHPKLNGGRDIKVPGTSHIKHNGQTISYHQDYFDSTHMLFGHIPVLKTIINAIKARLN
ncbi:nuclear transport factor 2 family protein [Reinekea sp. G2M2-21]|uniref:nuclear transport factor 2 family protein n=1 Tax=Reinekea sp. G2M2-21 TaxID=2788942 RepID=UPI001E577122|nr:nuclear transport factor 2 family protein [Reinekea sp. G2M2-21]